MKESCVVILIAAINVQPTFSTATAATIAPASAPNPIGENRTPVCIVVSLDPNSYRANPEGAKKSQDFLQQLESQFSLWIADYLRSAANKADPSQKLSSSLDIKAVSASVLKQYRASLNCGPEMLRLNAVSRYNVRKYHWTLNLNIHGRNGDRSLTYIGVDKYKRGPIINYVDTFGGMGDAVYAHNREIFQALLGEKR